MLYTSCMSKLDKLIGKLHNNTITADELRTLLRKLGWELDSTVGSHEQWRHSKKEYPNNRFTLATHSKELKRYQMKEARAKMGLEDE